MLLCYRAIINVQLINKERVGKRKLGRKEKPTNKSVSISKRLPTARRNDTDLYKKLDVRTLRLTIRRQKRRNGLGGRWVALVSGSKSLVEAFGAKKLEFGQSFGNAGMDRTKWVVVQGDIFEDENGDGFSAVEGDEDAGAWLEDAIISPARNLIYRPKAGEKTPERQPRGVDGNEDRQSPGLGGSGSADGPSVFRGQPESSRGRKRGAKERSQRLGRTRSSSSGSSSESQTRSRSNSRSPQKITTGGNSKAAPNLMSEASSSGGTSHGRSASVSPKRARLDLTSKVRDDRSRRTQSVIFTVQNDDDDEVDQSEDEEELEVPAMKGDPFQGISIAQIEDRIWTHYPDAKWVDTEEDKKKKLELCRTFDINQLCTLCNEKQKGTQYRHEVYCVGAIRGFKCLRRAHKKCNKNREIYLCKEPGCSSNDRAKSIELIYLYYHSVSAGIMRNNATNPTKGKEEQKLFADSVSRLLCLQGVSMLS